jgi:hypothetical protein
MSDTGLTAPGMVELPRRYDVTVTVDRNDSHPLNPAEFALAAEQAASARAASITSAHTARTSGTNLYFAWTGPFNPGSAALEFRQFLLPSQSPD